eukprot:CAMPEP_0204396174 /NCGR_PEP_ID=MMETSP0470-20130426/1187_1 /ASSEMBLY_ACC=CAM_ASM_000385 /TAXON_ID=2969 /ORGANISM="Oxyrrhis marina" /LENGTH=42 /DNA_ID= /DNA_START= /DNA_END= /DNA_ORIENTATION=
MVVTVPPRYEAVKLPYCWGCPLANMAKIGVGDDFEGNNGEFL